MTYLPEAVLRFPTPFCVFVYVQIERLSNFGHQVNVRKVQRL